MARWRWFVIVMAMVGITIFSFTIYSAEEDFLIKGSEKGIAFISGGVGLREREILDEMGKEYSLKLMFADKEGDYLSNVIVKIDDENGKSILTTISNGPWLFIDLPSGKYQLEASFEAERKNISLMNIEKGKQKVIYIQW